MTDWQFYLINLISRSYDWLTWFDDDAKHEYVCDDFGNLIETESTSVWFFSSGEIA